LANQGQSNPESSCTQQYRCVISRSSGFKKAFIPIAEVCKSLWRQEIGQELKQTGHFFYTVAQRPPPALTQ
jgi:hypothetical protein